jgi:hypothetical protein
MDSRSLCGSTTSTRYFEPSACLTVMLINRTKLKKWPLIAFWLALILQCPIAAARTNQTAALNPWIVAARLIRNGEQSASGIYLNPGLVITAGRLAA